MSANLDPKPWQSPDGYGFRYAEHFLPLIWLPRPEFDVGDNPILVDLAERVAEGRDLATEAAMFDFALDMQGIRTTATPEQITHARTVLEAIVRES